MHLCQFYGPKKGIELVSLHTFPLNAVLHWALGSLAHRLKVSIYLGIFCQLKESLVCTIAEYPGPAHTIRIIVWVQIPVNVSETDSFKSTKAKSKNNMFAYVLWYVVVGVR